MNTIIKKHTLLILLAILTFPTFLCAQDTGYVKYVIDGDTIVLKNGRKIRYIGIDTPEIAHKDTPAQPLGYVARDFNRRVVESRNISLEYDIEKNDHYGRGLAYVFLPDGTFVNYHLLASGMAYCLQKAPNLRYADILLDAQRKAMTARKGIWRGWNEERKHYIGNRRSKRFHWPTCTFGKKTNLKNRVEFMSRWDAFWQGYSPCSKCLTNKKAH